MKLFKIPAVLLYLLTFCSMSTNAALITEWGFEIDSGFTNVTGVGVTGSNNNAVWAAPSTLTWGSGASGPSSLDVGGSSNGNFSGNLFTDGAAVNTVSFTHTNNPITSGSGGLLSAVLNDKIVLTPLNPAGASFSPPSLFFDILFIETPNSGPCAASSPTPCNDIFVLDVAGAGFNPLNNTLNQNFNYGGMMYNARLFLDGLGVLEDNACLAANAAIGCIGFTTVENQVNTFQVALDITTRPFVVPEPSTIAILALGLLSLVVRRKVK